MKKGFSSVVEDAVPSNGLTKIFLTSKTPLHNDKKEIIGVLGISTDITEQKRLSEELRMAKENEEEIRKTVMVLAGDIAHDLRTPIATIMMITSILSNSIPPLLKMIECQGLEANALMLMNKQRWEYLRKIQLLNPYSILYR